MISCLSGEGEKGGWGGDAKFWALISLEPKVAALLCLYSNRTIFQRLSIRRSYDDV